MYVTFLMYAINVLSTPLAGRSAAPECALDARCGSPASALSCPWHADMCRRRGGAPPSRPGVSADEPGAGWWCEQSRQRPSVGLIISLEICKQQAQTEGQGGKNALERTRTRSLQPIEAVLTFYCFFFLT